VGADQLVTKLVFVLAVLMIPFAELVAGRIQPDFRAMDASATWRRPPRSATKSAPRGASVRSEPRRRRRANTAKQRRGWPRAPKAVSPVEEIEALEDVAPVSPATVV
jgi:hypothetical protein